MLIIYLILISGLLFSQENGNNINNNGEYKNIDINGDFLEDNLFEQLLTESKLFYAEASMSDLQGDSLNALYYFDNLLPRPYETL